ncbi:MAG: CHAT domain-containing protein [Bacteroidales bacterium]|nr:CHAT domain-containing protein [Bacteroidales bacterium]
MKIENCEMRSWSAILFFLLSITNLPVFAQEVSIDSIMRLHQSSDYDDLPDSLKADLCRRLAIENVRKSTTIAFSFADEFYHIAKSRKDETGEAIALNLMGVCLTSEGNLEKGLEYYLQSLAVRKKIGDQKMISNTTNNIGTVYIRLGDFETGIDYYRQALKMRIESNDEEGMAQTLNNMGVTSKMTGNYDSAIYYLEKSLAIKRKLNDKELIASSLNNLGEIAVLNGNDEKAMEYFNESLACREMIDDAYGISKTLVSMSDFFAKQGKYYSALQHLQRALIAIIPGFSDSGIYANPQPGMYDLDYNAIIILKNKAENFRDLFKSNPSETENLQACLDLHLLIIDFMDQIRQGYGDEKSKLYLMNNSRDMYSDAVTTAIDLLNSTGLAINKGIAFEIAERGKARILLDLITENEARITLRLPDSLLQTEEMLKHDLAMLQKMEHENPGINSSINDSLNKRIFEKKRQLEEFSEMLEDQYPEYATLKYTRAKLSFVDVQQSLSDDELFLQYHFTDSVLYTFIITATQNSIIQVELRPDFMESLRYLQAILNAGPGVNFGNHDSDFILSAHRLHDYLIAPVEHYVKKDKLIIVPDGPLFYIPFDLLLSEKAENENAGYATLPYLVNKYPISYSYSASMYINSKKDVSAKNEKNLVAFALSFKKTDYTYTAENVNYMTERGEELGALPGVKLEVDNILEIVDGEVYLDSMATEQKFKHLRGSQKVLHVATHGIIDNSSPMFSRLVFAPDSGNLEDGNLYTWELFNMEIHADLAVLSACNTGFGKLQQGEGMMTLARGFMYAGVPSLVISLWNVNDASTSKIMTRFYQYLSQGKEQAVALQMAKIDYLGTCDDIMANPWFWGGFVHLGNTNPLEFNQKSDYSKIIIFTSAIIALLILFAASRRLRRRG